MHFDVVLSVFIHPCSKTAEESSVDTALCVGALHVCVRVLQVCVCARASGVCVCACFRCVCVCVCFRCVCVCARTSDVCVCASVRGKLLTQRATVTPTIPSVLYALLVRSGSPYIES